MLRYSTRQVATCGAVRITTILQFSVMMQVQLHILQEAFFLFDSNYRYFALPSDIRIPCHIRQGFRVNNKVDYIARLRTCWTRVRFSCCLNHLITLYDRDETYDPVYTPVSSRVTRDHSFFMYVRNTSHHVSSNKAPVQKTYQCKLITAWSDLHLLCIKHDFCHIYALTDFFFLLFIQTLNYALHHECRFICSL